MMTSGALAGFPVVDLVATLYDGSYHDVDSSVLAFQIAARQAFRYMLRLISLKKAFVFCWDINECISSLSDVCCGLFLEIRSVHESSAKLVRMDPLVVSNSLL